MYCIPSVEVTLFLFLNLEENILLESAELADFGEAVEGLGDGGVCEFESLECNIHYLFCVTKLFDLLYYFLMAENQFC